MEDEQSKQRKNNCKQEQSCLTLLPHKSRRKSIKSTMGTVDEEEWIFFDKKSSS